MPPCYATHSGTTAEEILYVLGGMQTVHLDRIGFCVITGTYIPHRLEPQDWPFTPGEIIVIDHSRDGSREFLGARNLDYNVWEDVRWVTYFGALGSCLTIADKVRSDSPRGYYAWTADGLSYAADQEAAYHEWAGDPDAYIYIGDHVGRGHTAEWRERQAEQGGTVHDRSET
jgi:hypothetical protein